MNVFHRLDSRGIYLALIKTGKFLFACLARSLEQISTLVMTLLAARFLIPAEYGVYSLGIMFIVFVQTIAYTGFYHFILTSKEDDRALLSTCFWLTVALVTAASVILGLSAYPLEWIFDAHPLGNVLFLLAAVQPLASVAAWGSAALLRRGDIMLNFSILFAQNLITLVGGVLLMWLMHSIYALVAFRYLRVVSGALLFVILGKERPALQFDKRIARKAVTFSGGLYGSSVLKFLARYAADLLLGIFHSPAAVGLYRFGNRVATGATDVFNQPMASFAMTQFGSTARRDEDLAIPLARFSGTIALLCGMTGVVLIVFVEDVIRLFFQASYLPALVVTYAMALRAVAGVGQLLIQPSFAALGRTTWVMMFDFVSTIVAVAAIFVASPAGLNALAWTQAAVVLGTTFWAFHLLRKKGDINVMPAIWRFGGAVILSTIYGAMLYLLQRELAALSSLAAMQALALGLAGAVLLALPVVALAARLRIFSFETFSG